MIASPADPIDAPGGRCDCFGSRFAFAFELDVVEFDAAGDGDGFEFDQQ
jgi:hypothetical protein